MTVRLTGSFSVTRGDVPTDGPGIGSRKARRLLMLLAVHPGQVVGVDRIVDVLWGNDPPRDPEQNVATLVSRLRSALGSTTIVGSRAGYRLGSPPQVRVDVDDAGELIAEAGRRLEAGEPGMAVTAALRGLEIFGAGSLLVDESNADWLIPARAAVQRVIREARHTVASAALRIDDPATALTVSEAAITADRFDEAAHRFLMRAYTMVGEPARALEAYESLRAALASELGVDPAPQTRAVHLALLREQEPATAPMIPAERLLAAPAPNLPGRTGEIARLRAAWSAAAAGQSALLLVTGEAGIGKTRLTAEVVTLADSTGGLVLQARCYAAERSLFLQPFVDALAGPLAGMRPDQLSELPGARAVVAAGLLPGAGEVFGVSSTERAAPEVELRRAFDGITVLLCGLAVRRPVLLVLDDLQNAGRATVELLHYLARHARRARLLVISTIRAEEGAAVIDAA